MGILVRSVQYLHAPSLEVETSDGIKYIIESGSNGALVIKSDKQMFAELGRPCEVVVRQLQEEEEIEQWAEARIIFP